MTLTPKSNLYGFSCTASVCAKVHEHVPPNCALANPLALPTHFFTCTWRYIRTLSLLLTWWYIRCYLYMVVYTLLLLLTWWSYVYNVQLLLSTMSIESRSTSTPLTVPTHTKFSASKRSRSEVTRHPICDRSRLSLEPPALAIASRCASTPRNKNPPMAASPRRAARVLAAAQAKTTYTVDSERRQATDSRPHGWAHPRAHLRAHARTSTISDQSEPQPPSTALAASSHVPRSIPHSRPLSQPACDGEQTAAIKAACADACHACPRYVRARPLTTQLPPNTHGLVMCVARIHIRRSPL